MLLVFLAYFLALAGVKCEARNQRRELPELWNRIANWTAKPCDTCLRPKVEDHEKAFRLQIIKGDILNKLGLEKLPAINTRHSPRIKDTVAQSINAYLQSTSTYSNQRAYVIPEVHYRSTSPGGNQLKMGFQFPASFMAGDVVSAELCIYLGNRQRRSTGVCTFSSAPCNSKSEPKEQKLRASIKSGWMQIDLRLNLIDWLQYRELCHNITVQCDTESTAGSRIAEHEPFLLVTTNAMEQVVRSKRGVDCTEGVTECCREKLKVNFKDIDMEWVVGPPSFNAFYCKGSCTKFAGLTTNYYYNFIEKSKDYSNDIQLAKYPTVCCSPQSFSPLEIIVVTQEGVPRKSMLPDTIVESCGCL